MDVIGSDWIMDGKCVEYYENGQVMIERNYKENE